MTKSTKKYWVVIGVLSILIFQFAKPWVSSARSKSLSVVQFRSIFWERGISNEVFHFSPFKLQLAKLVQLHKKAAVVGLLDGSEAYWLAKEGFDVYAFEPLQKFTDNFLKRINARNISNIRVIQKAADKTSGNLIDISYENTSNVAETTRIDENIRHHLDVISVDVQGSELDVLQGAVNLLSTNKVRSLWVEIKACNENVPILLKMLLKYDYVLYDFVPWGELKQPKRKLSILQASSYIGNSVLDRPLSIDAYLNWMCTMKSKFWYLQTDVLAVKSEIVTRDFEDKLKTLAHDILYNGLMENWIDKRSVHYL